jgi:transposase
MRKFKEVLRLHSMGLKQRQIAGSCAIAQSTVHEYLKAAAQAGVSWPLPAEWNEQQLEEALSRKPRPGAPARQAALPDFPAIRKQLQTHRNLTLQLLWEEYREGNAADGYSYSRFCELYHGWARRLDVVLRHDHRAGEKMFVDYAGAKIPMYDRQTGEVVYQAAIFVAVLGASSYTFAEATQSQELSCWIGSQVRALEFLGGVPELWRARHKRVYVKDRIMRRKSSGNAKRVAVVHGSFA